MLASTCIELAPSVNAPIGPALPLLVELPPEMSNYFVESGYLQSVYGESRGQARLRVRCEAILESDFVPPFATGKRLARVFLKDMSRSGLGLLSHEQLWPGETFGVELRDRRLHVRVVRCRKISDRCFEIGGLVLSVN